MNYFRRARGHKTSNSKVTIHYRFHPLSGQTFLCIRTRLGPPATHLIQTRVRRLGLPTWMAEPEAAECQLIEEPFVGIEYLCALSDVIAFPQSEAEAACELSASTAKPDHGEHGTYDPDALPHRAGSPRAGSNRIDRGAPPGRGGTPS